eukprot:2308643-Pyramimonas_sp.AAC.1
MAYVIGETTLDCAKDGDFADVPEPDTPPRTPALEEEDDLKRPLSMDPLYQPTAKERRTCEDDPAADALDALGFRPNGGVVPVPAGKAALNDFCRGKATARPDDEAFYVIDLGVVERQLADWRRLLPR